MVRVGCTKGSLRAIWRLRKLVATRTPKGHDIIAARVLPCVLRALGRKG